MSVGMNGSSVSGVDRARSQTASAATCGQVFTLPDSFFCCHMCSVFADDFGARRVGPTRRVSCGA